jgi:hypothetical protein
MHLARQQLKLAVMQGTHTGKRFVQVLNTHQGWLGELGVSHDEVEKQALKRWANFSRCVCMRLGANDSLFK